MIAQPKEIEIYVTDEGVAPFETWLSGIADKRTQAVIDARLARARLGLIGDAREVGDGVHELKIDFGSGFRLYFANVGRTMIVLLLGGSKGTQKRDIKLAKQYLVDYEKRRAAAKEKKR